MTYAEIWNLPEDQRLAAFVARYKDLDENTGNRTGAERDEMQAIAEIAMRELIRGAERVRVTLNEFAYECPTHHMTGADPTCDACNAKNRANPNWSMVRAVVEAMRGV